MQKQRSRKQSPPKHNLDLEPYIRIQTEKSAAKPVSFHGIEFHLNAEIIRRLQRARFRGEMLRFKKLFLTDLRYHAINCSPITFLTYYGDDTPKEACLRTVVFLDGNAIQQIRSDCLEDTEFALALTSTHFWLIQQLLMRLRFHPRSWIEGVSWLLAALFVVGAVMLTWPYFQQPNPTAWLAPILVLVLLKWAIAFFLNGFVSLLRRWFLHQMLFGIFSHREQRRKMALNLIDRL